MVKKKVSDSSTQQEVAGVSKASKALALENARATLQSGKNIIQLAVAGGRVLEFELMTIPSNKIMEVTRVAEDNQRDQDLLNEYYCEDIIPTIEEYGIQNPALGELNDGIIYVSDGSRRRFSAYFTGKDYKIYATKSKLTRAEISFLSEIGNLNKHISLYERGGKYRSLLDSGVYADQNELAAGEKVDPAIVSVSLKAFDRIPREIAKKIPAIDHFGRTSINDIVKKLDLADKQDKEAKEQFINSILSIDLNTVKENTTSPTAKNMNKAFMAMVNNFAPKRKATRKPRKTEIASRGKTKISLYKETKSEFSIQVQHASEDDKQKILEFAKKLLG